MNGLPLHSAGINAHGIGWLCFARAGTAIGLVGVSPESVERALQKLKQQEQIMADMPTKKVSAINQRKSLAMGKSVEKLPNQAKLAGVAKPGKGK